MCPAVPMMIDFIHANRSRYLAPGCLIPGLPCVPFWSVGEKGFEFSPLGRHPEAPNFCQRERGISPAIPVLGVPSLRLNCRSAQDDALKVVMWDLFPASIYSLPPPQNATIEIPLMATSLTSAFSPEVIRQHGLTLDEYEKIRQLLGGREPSLTELGIFSVMWSEHCSYKSSRVHLKRLPTRSKRVLQGPGENAGIIDIGDGWACAFKIESHNHPSFIEPFQGAATGVGGILRDIFTMGARPLAVMDSLRFGPIASGKPADQSTIHRNHSILEGVVSGIASYGNCFGVPNLGGETKFESCYSQNPLVNAFALGLVRRDQIFYAKAAGEGNPVIYVGAKTGRDGIHGATMASEEFSEGSEQKRPNVQVGDPFLEKLLLE